MSRQPISIELIDPNPYQPRQNEDLEVVKNLALSIARDGLLQPPAARQVNGRYQLAFGHTRLAAFRWLVANAFGHDFEAMPLELVELSDEAMYRHAVTENLQRKDLSPIEEAKAMKRAMQDFGYNSGQVGDLFGKSDSTVRGTIRLLDLDDDFQAQLNNGEMTVGTARKILAMQKVVKPESMEYIKDKKYGRDINEAVTDAIDQRVADLLRMHSQWSDGEPKGGPSLWPLKWTYGLPYTTPTNRQFLQAWDGEKERYGRQVIDVVDGFERDILSINPSTAKTWADLYAEKGEQWGDVIDLLKQLMQPPACTACDFYVKQGGYHYCGLKACHNNKTQRWTQLELERLSKELDIPIYNKERDGKDVINMDANWSDLYQAWWKQKHPDMRLVAKKSAYSNAFTAHAAIGVVMTGETVAKAKEQASEKDDGLSYSEILDIKRKYRGLAEDAIERFIWYEAVPVFADALASVPKSIQKIIDEAFSYRHLPDGAGEQAKKLSLRATFRLIGSHKPQLLESVGDLTLTPVQDAARHLKGVAKEWGVKLPAAWKTIAEDYEPADLEELLAPLAVSAETEA